MIDPERYDEHPSYGQEETLYKVIRFTFDDERREVIKTGLTLEEAQEHCNDPETSSTTCSDETAAERAEEGIYGPWFDGYDEE